jgi:hypothetical protein
VFLRLANLTESRAGLQRLIANVDLICSVRREKGLSALKAAAAGGAATLNR